MANLGGITRGRRLLIAVLQVTTATDIGARCGVYQQRVSDWVSGMRTPSAASRQALERNYRIPCAAWDMPYISSMGDILHRSNHR